MRAEDGGWSRESRFEAGGRRSLADRRTLWRPGRPALVEAEAAVALTSYRPDIDGLRAVAVLLVVVYHTGLGFRGGYIGVDVFFVISGFLISGLLRKEIAAGTFGYGRFWERRVRRLLPALMVVTAFAALAGCLILLPNDLTTLGGALISQPLLLANLYTSAMFDSGYFGTAIETFPLMHTWSLGVEEQFYLAFPFLLVLLAPARRREALVLVLLALGSLVWSIELTSTSPNTAFFTLPCRAWELLSGALLGLLPPPPRWLAQGLSAAGLWFILWAGLTFGDQNFPGRAALVPCFGTAILIYGNQRGTLVGRLLSLSVLVRVGLISYSLYLWHWVVFCYLNYLALLATEQARLGAVALSFVLAELSWRWLETPVRRGTRLAQPRHMVGLFMLYLVGAVGVGSFFYLRQGFPERWSEEARRLQAQPLHFTENIHVDPAHPERLHFVGDLTQPRAAVLLWGDSMAGGLVPAVDALGKARGVKVLRSTMSGTRGALPQEGTPGSQARFAKYTMELAKRERPRWAILASRWNEFSETELLTRVEATVRAFQETDTEVMLVLESTHLPYPAHRVTALRTRFPSLPPARVEASRQRADSERILGILDRLPDDVKAHLHVVDTGPTLVGWGELYAEGELLYTDTHHLAEAGALRLRPLLEPAFR